MDRIISLLAALVGLIALGGAVLVHTNVDAERRQMAADLAQMKVSLGLAKQQQVATTVPAVPAPAPTGAEAPSAAAAPPAPDDGTADALLALQNRVAVLEQMMRDQADQLDAARAELTAMASASASAAPPATEIAAASVPPAAPAAATSSEPAAYDPNGPTTECIPLGTRFMGSAGDSFPICKTKTVVKVAAVTDGTATIDGAGPVAAGGFGNLTTRGCTVMVFSADSASGYAEMRVTCQ